MPTLHAKVKFYCTQVNWPAGGPQVALLVAVADATIPAPQQIATGAPPVAEVQVAITNPALFGMFTLGQSYYIDISPI
jgi:hypothetical protein